MISGGLRARFLNDSLTAVVRDGLEALGWFDPGRHHMPLTLLAVPKPWNETVEFNTMMIGTLSRNTEHIELGSLLTEDTIKVAIDFYAETASIGMHVSNDVRDLLRGRLGGVTQGGSFPIYDYRHATPPVVGHALIGDVTAGKLPVRQGQIYTRHWYVIDSSITDTYYDSGEE